jgi:hypothetical protein
MTRLAYHPAIGSCALQVLLSSTVWQLGSLPAPAVEYIKSGTFRGHSVRGHRAVHSLSAKSLPR